MNKSIEYYEDNGYKPIEDGYEFLKIDEVIDRMNKENNLNLKLIGKPINVPEFYDIAIFLDNVLFKFYFGFHLDLIYLLLEFGEDILKKRN